MINVNTNQQQSTNRQAPAPTIKRGRGRPPGSKNKPKVPPAEFSSHEREEGWSFEAAPDISKKPSVALRRKWQREWIRPQFAISRREVLELFVRYLRSTQGKKALQEILMDGFTGISKLSDGALGKYLERTHLLSRYPHDVIIKG
jgi:hypothetical protein